MDARAFLGLCATHNPYRWNLEVTSGLITNGGFLMGGTGLAAAISAMEGTAARPCVWATAQYLDYAKLGEVVDIDVTVAVEGHQITQARAVGHVGNREILTVNAALALRPAEETGQWESMPEVPPPEDCPPRPSRMAPEGTISERLDIRLANGRMHEDLDGLPSADGRIQMWASIPEMIEYVDATALAVLGDYVPSGVGQALGRVGGGNSLDNTLRVARLVPTHWVLLDVQVHAVHNGFGHGLAHMFAEDGTLLATASQSCIVRFWRPRKGARS
ncbi:MAG: acyl-CoA thioesterase [Acidimicrobiaceae bacterium]|jgi:acyl-CoA thioesterase|nr:acyl-CoA thioesterase [Acidimicrobiaceae bacterium]